MRVERLVMRGVGVFHQEQVVDFTGLTRSGLFLIDGPTGAGKSTVIDAIVFALYGGVAGSQSSETRIRSTRCTDDEPSVVELTFAVDGRRFFVTRTATQTKATRATPVPESVSMWEILPDGTKGNAASATKVVNTFLADLLRMDHSAFRRLVVLPQGEFAELLLMKPSSRYEALKKLISDDLYARIAAEFEERGKAALASRKAAVTQIDAARNQLLGALGDGWPESVAAHIEAIREASGSQIDEAVQVVVEDISVLQRDAEATASQAEARLAKAVTERDDALAVRRSLSEVTQARERLESARAGLDDADRVVPVDDVRAQVVHMRERVGALRPKAQWERDEQARVKAATTRAERLEGFAVSLAALERDEAQLPQQIAEMAAQIATAAAIARDIDVRKLAMQATQSALDAAQALGSADAACAQALAAWQSDADACEAARSEQADAREHAQDLVDLQLRQRAAALAALLVAGEPCTVCGSTQHPSPAVNVGVERLVVDADVAAARSVVEAKQRVVDDLERVRDAAKATYDERTSAAERLRGAVGSRSQEELADDLATATRRYNEAVAASASEETLAAERDSLSDRLGTLQQLRAEISGQRDAVLAEDRAAQQMEQAAKDEIADLAAPYSTAVEALDVVERRLRSIDAVLEAHDRLGKALHDLPEGAADLDSDAAEAAAVAAVEAHQVADATAKVARAEATRLGNTSASLDDRRAHLRSALEESAEVITATQTVIDVAGVVLATSSINSQKIPLVSYVAQRRFDAVLNAASAQLLQMSSGRYSLELDRTARNGANTGLGIAVVDGMDGKSRDPGTLSGGERFYASLALALGLAEIVRGEAGGAPLETLFVDEGFGSLDVETLGTVVEQMERLREAGRVVGVISHVTEMKRHFPERIEVVKGPDGTSTIVQPQTI